MTRPVTENDLADVLEADRSWRRREISFLKSAFEKASFEQRSAFGRASYVALYAHWEGFVREAAQAYLHHVSFRGLRYVELKPGILFAVHPNATGPIRAAGDNYKLASERLDELLTLREKTFRNKKPEINTRSNLNFEILGEIDCVLGNVGLAGIAESEWLDRLLKKRNTIAHGKSALVDFEEFETLVEKVTAWMDAIIAVLTNAALQKVYRLAPPPLVVAQPPAVPLPQAAAAPP